MKKRNSFTLIEMLVVIFIMILMIAVIIVVFQRGNFETKQNDGQRKKDMADLSLAIEAFKADKGHYPLINWGIGTHAFETTPSLAGHLECDGTVYSSDITIGSLYKPSFASGSGFYPGVEIRFTEDTNQPCDDLSLQLLGTKYLAKLPQGTDAEVTDKGDWVNGTKAYLDEIPQDPQLSKPWDEQAICKDDCTPCTGDPYKPTADYDISPLDCPAPSILKNHAAYFYRYFYNSYYACLPEAVNVGDRYWMNAIMQLKENGDYDDPANPILPGTGLYVYELGNVNYWRLPRSYCGG